MITACVQRLMNNCLSREIQLTENNSQLKAPLHSLLVRHYSQVLRQAASESTPRSETLQRLESALNEVRA